MPPASGRARTWTNGYHGPPPARLGGTALLPADGRRTWLISGMMAAPGNRIERQPARTDDGGATWRRLPMPCARQVAEFDLLAAYGERHIWAICGSEMGAGAQLKAVSRSDDSGQHWRLVLAPGLFGLQNLTGAGYLNSVVLTSPSTAWPARGRYTLMHTADGGRTWHVAIPRNRASPGDGGWGLCSSSIRGTAGSSRFPGCCSVPATVAAPGGGSRFPD